MSIAIDMGVSVGTPQGYGSGLLHSVSASPNQIPDPATYITPLKPKLWRTGPYGNNNGANSFDLYNYLYSLGVRQHQFDMTLWFNFFSGSINDTVDYVANLAVTNSYDFVWNIQNEPEQNGYTYSTWYTRYKAVVARLRTHITSPKITGPDLGAFNETWIKDFLTAAYTDGYLPNIITWHELQTWTEEYGGNPHLYQNVGIICDYLDAHPEFGTPEICIQEYTRPEESLGLYSSGGAIDHFCAVERLSNSRGRKITCIRGSWQVKQVDKGPSDSPAVPYIPSDANQNLDGLLTYDKHGDTYGLPPTSLTIGKRGLWWAHKAYADLSGTLCQLTRSMDFDGLASKDSDAGNAILVLCSRNSRTISTDAVNVVLSNIPSYLISAGKITAKIESIPETQAILPAMPVISQLDYTVTSSSATIPASIPVGGAIKITISGTSQPLVTTVKGIRII